MHVTSAGSDLVFPDEQVILDERVDIMLESRKDKAGVTKRMIEQTKRVYEDFKPDVVIDSCNKRTLNLFGGKISTPYIFMSHNITPIGVKDTSQIDGQFKASKIFHVGVSKLQNENYSNIFDDIIPVHLADQEFIQEVQSPEGYAMHISRWDKYKAPWVVLNKFLKNTKNTYVHFFTTFDGNDLDGTEEALKKLQDDGRVIFHVDTNRREMLDYMTHANVFLGNPIESAGITALEANQNGVPYLVHLKEDKRLAQEEYLVPYGYKKSIGEDYVTDFWKLFNSTLEERHEIADWTRNEYGYQSFYESQMRAIEGAIKLRTYDTQELDLF
jgi:glycosyltransferase involved in cell wall biosynthesis